MADLCRECARPMDVTDAQVEAAAEVIYMSHRSFAETPTWGTMDDWHRDGWRAMARHALEAASEARND